MPLEYYVAQESCPTYTNATCADPALAAPDNSLVVVNVRDFLDSCYPPSGGAPSSGQVNDAIRAAAESIPEEGGILYFPEGVYELYGGCPIITLKSRTWVRGAGRGTILRNVGGIGMIFWIAGVSDVRVSDVVFDVNHGVCDPPNSYSQNFPTAIGIGAGPALGAFLHSSNITIENCVFRTSGGPTKGQTLMAVNAAYADGLYLRRNHVVNMQFLVAGDIGVTRCVIEDNVFEDPYNLAITAYLRYSDGVVTDLKISRNTIINLPSAGGIAVGTDGSCNINEVTQYCPIPGEALQRIIITDNVLRGVFGGVGEAECVVYTPSNPTGYIATGAACAIIVNVPEYAEDVLISGNVIDHTGEPTSNTLGIVIQGQTPSALRSVIVSRNHVRGVDQAGVRAHVSVEKMVIEDNFIDGRGIAVGPGPDGINLLEICGNQLIRGGIDLNAYWADIAYAGIRENLIKGPGVATTQNYAAIAMTTASGRTIVADVVGNTVVFDAPANHAYGVLESGSGTFGPMRYLDNNFPPESSTAPLVTPLELVTTGAILRRNAGAADHTTGAGMIYYGQTAPADETTIYHGIARGFVPHITITATGERPASWGDGGLVWVSEVTSEYFKVKCAQPPTSASDGPYEFGWRAELVG